MALLIALILLVLRLLLLRLLRLLILIRLLGLLILATLVALLRRLLTLLWGLLLRRLVIRVRLPWTLGVPRRSGIVRDLRAVGGLIPALLRLLRALLAWNLLSAR